jgi:hypothetical protein
VGKFGKKTANLVLPPLSRRLDIAFDLVNHSIINKRVAILIRELHMLFKVP